VEWHYDYLRDSLYACAARAAHEREYGHARKAKNSTELARRYARRLREAGQPVRKGARRATADS
jgi:hypothetical protein